MTIPTVRSLPLLPALLLALLLAPQPALAHGDQFGAAQIAVYPDDSTELWTLITGFGLGHSPDGGASWTWACTASFGTTRAYDVLAVAPGEALVSTTEGVVRVGEDCGSTLFDGIPGLAGSLTRDGDDVLVGVSGTEAGGVYRCTGNSCAPTELAGANLFVRSLLGTDRGFLVTVVTGDSLASALWSSPDGDRWTLVNEWPDGSIDPTLFFAREDTLLLWSHPRASEGIPALLRSIDGGVHFESVLETGTASDPVAGFASVKSGATLLLGPGQGQTLRSTDDGLHWEDISEEAPEVICGETQGEQTWICTDHLLDGVDVMVTLDALTFVPVACLEEASPAACAEATCADQATAYTYSANSGGGRCDIIICPDDASEEPREEDKGCGHRSLLLLLLPASLRRRGRSLPSRA